MLLLQTPDSPCGLRGGRPATRDAIPREEGFTLVEVMVAVFVFAAGALGVLQLLDVSTRNTYRAEQGQVANNIAQRELEEIRQLDFDEVGLTAAPTPTPPTLQSRVVDGTFALNPDGTDPAELVVNGANGASGGVIAPGPEEFVSGDVSGEIYRFVVWRDEPGCEPTACPSSHDYKRIVVVVQLDDEGITAERPYAEIQSDVTDPDATIIDGAGPGAGTTPVSGQQLFLSDTPCAAQTGEPVREEITADHPTHDTLGSCAGPSGRPDSLLFNQAPDPEPANPSVPALFDYADDVEPGGTASGTDAGLQLLRPASDGCDPDYAAADAAKQRHHWATRPLSSDFVVTGTATLELYTRTINSVNVPGGICVSLYERSSSDSGDIRTALSMTGISAAAEDPFGFSCETMAGGTAGTCRTNVWPRGDWARARFNIAVGGTTIDAGNRLELALSIERSATPEDALEFAYDHPDYPARLEVKTSTPVTD